MTLEDSTPLVTLNGAFVCHGCCEAAETYFDGHWFVLECAQHMTVSFGHNGQVVASVRRGVRH